MSYYNPQDFLLVLKEESWPMYISLIFIYILFFKLLMPLFFPEIWTNITPWLWHCTVQCFVDVLGDLFISMYIWCVVHLLSVDDPSGWCLLPQWPSQYTLLELDQDIYPLTHKQWSWLYTAGCSQKNRFVSLMWITIMF